MDKGWDFIRRIAEEPFAYYVNWLKEKLPAKSCIGLNPFLFLASEVDIIRARVMFKEMTVKFLDEDLVDKLWKDKPPASKAPVIVHDVKYSGESTVEKLNTIREIIENKRCDSALIYALDQIAWILNLRGSDIKFNPYFMSYLIITLDEGKPTVTLYSDIDKFKNEKVQNYLKDNNVKLVPYESIAEDAAKLEGRRVAVELALVNAKISSILKNKASEMVDLGEEIALLKVKKNETQLKGFRACHIRDGAGLVKCLAWLEHQLNVLNRTDLDEYMASEKILEYRKEQDMFMGLSFHTVSSIGANGSIYYRPKKGNSAILNKKEIYLLDSGAHYL